MSPEVPARRGLWAAALIGFALSGFFDGILLHQILQWHHLLLGVDAFASDLDIQLMADGLFHLLMYAIAVLGLLLMWSARHSAFDSRAALAYALVGFGMWHVVDAVVSHWLLSLHRIRMDVPNPLFWDLLWLLLFGLAPLIAGLLLRRSSGGGQSPARPATIIAITIIVAASAWVAARPPAGATSIAVLMRPGADPNPLITSVAAAHGGVVWANRSGSLWVFSIPSGAAPRDLYRHGAMLVTSSPAALGCLSWVRPPLS